MVFEAAELPQQRGLAIQVQKSLASNPINADKGLVVDSSTTQILLKNPGHQGSQEEVGRDRKCYCYTVKKWH